MMMMMMMMMNSEDVVTWRDKRQVDPFIPSPPTTTTTTTTSTQPSSSSSCDSSCASSNDRPLNPTLRAIVPPGYDRYRLPDSPDGGPLPVFISTKVRDIQKIDEQNMELIIEWYIRLYWSDLNLTPPANLPDGQWYNVAPDIAQYVWLPTTYIDHVKEVTKPTLLVQPESFRMQNNGFIRYSMS
ncbi:hypothetical protein Pmani_023327 [Petrolisthes manimaculis]|uniref:Neurotransmitter-gated ion-channel ligand-binding domain-containing protein n=1 Tax=Petrolisthes manimaculis TaxID=1843537 RepID=A0AAE1U3G3_9EUCA|nr:hypothetical protein Pmani_023327 [Petrolisthes manimaculis]